MQRVQTGHEVLSLWGLTPNKQALTASSLKTERTSALVKAFLIVLCTAAALGVVSRLDFSTSSTAGTLEQPAVIVEHTEEPVAYQAGQFVSAQLRRGYLGQ